MSSQAEPGPLVAATHNAGSCANFATFSRPISIESGQRRGFWLARAEETGDTFEANAKVESARRGAGRRAAGAGRRFRLCRRGLGGAPGICSARWAGGSKDFSAAMARIERELARASGASALARAFRQRLALAWPADHVEYFEGQVDGACLPAARGRMALAMIRFPARRHSRGFGRMSAEEKQRVPADGSLLFLSASRARLPKLARACL